MTAPPLATRPIWLRDPRAERGRAPETRALVAAALLAAAAVVASPGGFVLAGACLAASAWGLWLAAGAGTGPLSGRDLGRLAALAALAVALNAVFAPGAPLTVAGRELPVSAEGIRLGGETALRLVALVLLFHGTGRAFSPFTALAGLERALSRWRPGRRHPEGLEVVVLVALRLGSTLGLEARRLTVQRALRAAWPGPGATVRERRRRLALRLRDLPAVVVPLSLLVVRRAEELAWALGARYYGVGTRTPAALAPWRGRDWTAVAAGAVLLGWVAWSRAHG